jgi:hypothetical protein
VPALPCIAELGRAGSYRTPPRQPCTALPSFCLAKPSRAALCRPCIAAPRRARPRCASPCPAGPASLCRVMSSPAELHSAGLALPSRAEPRRAGLYRATLRRPCIAEPSRALPCRVLPDPAKRCQPCIAVPCVTGPCSAFTSLCRPYLVHNRPTAKPTAPHPCECVCRNPRPAGSQAETEPHVRADKYLPDRGIFPPMLEDHATRDA